MNTEKGKNKTICYLMLIIFEIANTFTHTSEVNDHCSSGVNTAALS